MRDLLPLSLLLAVCAGSEPLFREDFESLAGSLQLQQDETAAPGVFGWTKTAPPGWMIDDGAMPAQSGTAEWQGWTFATMPFWSTVSGGQDRSAFTRAEGVFAIADPDEWDDVNGPSATGRFDSALVSPPIAIPAATETYLRFDSDYRQDNDQIGELFVSYDGGAPERLLRYDAVTGSLRNAAIEIALPSRAGPSTAVFRWRLSNAGNDWWWAIDNVELDTEPTPPPPPRGPSPFGRRRVVIIGIDGLRSDALLAADTPFLDGLSASGAAALDGLCTVGQSTVSGPGWSSICTAVWVDKHNVSNNLFTAPHYDQFPHFFVRIREAHPAAYLASIVNWTPINSLILQEADLVRSGLADAQVASEAAALIVAEGPDVVFLHFDDCDAAGHATGFTPGSPAYLDAIERTDALVGQVLGAIDARLNANEDEEWLVLVTTDHGGTPGGTHGGQSAEERFVPIIAAGKGVRQGAITEQTYIVDVPAIAMRHLRIPIDQAWGWEGGYLPWLPFALEDLDVDGDVDAIDIQILVNGALGLPTPTDADINRDGSADAVDLQQGIAVALGIRPQS